MDQNASGDPFLLEPEEAQKKEEEPSSKKGYRETRSLRKTEKMATEPEPAGALGLSEQAPEPASTSSGNTAAVGGESAAADADSENKNYREKRSLRKQKTATGGMDSAGQGDNPELEALEQLLQKPPGVVAAWTLKEVSRLGEAEALVESTPIFKVASALKSAPVEQKEALISSIMGGVQDLPREEQAQFLKVFAQLPTAGTAPSPGAASASLASSSSDETDAHVKLLSTNFSRIAEEADFKNMPPEDMERIAEVVQQEQGQLVQPLLDAVDELDAAERQAITEALVSKGVVSTDQRAMLEETLKPGGHADKLANMMKWMAFAYKYAWILAVMPAIEIVIIVVLATSGCSVPLLTWFIVDAGVATGLVAAAYAAKMALTPAYKEFTNDPIKMSKRVHQATSTGEKITVVVPGLSRAAHFIAFAVFLLFIGAVMVVMGVMQLLETQSIKCDAGYPRPLAIFASLPIMVLRVLMWTACVYAGLKAWSEYKKYKGGTAADSSDSRPLMSAPDSDYGTVPDGADGGRKEQV